MDVVHPKIRAESRGVRRPCWTIHPRVSASQRDETRHRERKERSLGIQFHSRRYRIARIPMIERARYSTGGRRDPSVPGRHLASKFQARTSDRNP